MVKRISDGIYKLGNKLVTVNSTPGETFFGEKIIRKKGVEYRVWDPRRSKIAAAILKGIKLPVDKDSVVLYLGAASGQTCSFLSDVVKKIYAVEIAPRVFRELYLLAKKRKNILPILADASKPESYKEFVPKVDFVFQDVAARNQLQIFLDNCRMFLKKKGYGMVAVKSRSIDVTESPRKVFDEFERGLKKELKVVSKVRLEPFEKDHMVFLVTKKR